jgi:hypothetical protein
LAIVKGNLQTCQRYIVRAKHIDAGGELGSSLLLAAQRFGSAEESVIVSSVVYSGGDMNLEDASGSILVCAGDCVIRGRISHCLVIAGGSVTCQKDASYCRILAGGSIAYPPKARLRGAVIQENQSKPLGFVRFIPLSRLGITLDATGPLTVKEAERDNLFHKAGLRAGDRIVSVNGCAMKSSEALRQTIRSLVAMEGEGVFEIRRGQRSISIPIDLRAALPE